jgi:hypothetical protein
MRERSNTEGWEIERTHRGSEKKRNERYPRAAELRARVAGAPLPRSLQCAHPASRRPEIWRTAARPRAVFWLGRGWRCRRLPCCSRPSRRHWLRTFGRARSGRMGEVGDPRPQPEQNRRLAAKARGGRRLSERYLTREEQAGQRSGWEGY